MTDERIPEIVLNAERLHVAGVFRQPVERVRLRRRIVTEVRQVEVTVRREELVVDHDRLDGSDVEPEGTEHVDHEPLVLTLSEEVPYVELRVQPYERVVATVHEVHREQTLRAPVGREQIDVVVDDPTGRLGQSGPVASL